MTDHRPLGGTGMLVSPLCLGAMMFGAWGNRDEDECIRIVHRALDAGINVIDTADVYSGGESETIVGRALAGRRDDVILATKGHFPLTGAYDPHPQVNAWGSSRRWLTRALDASLRRLGVDHVDLYQVHRPDPATDIDETLAALTDFVTAGKVRAIGCSTFPPSQLVEAHWVAERRGRAVFRTEQPPYSVFTRWAERELFPTTQRYRMGTLVWGPLNGGWLSGAYRAGQGPRREGRARALPDHFVVDDEVGRRKLAIVEELVAMAADLGTTLPRLAVAWALRHPAVTTVIIGPRTLDHLEGLLGADELVLPDELLDRIDELVPPGTNVDPLETMWEPPELRRPELRRRR
jgi:aryl-alcohol dehydrogenase-like predicted oxidoreductase